MSTPAPTMFVFGAGENLIEEMEENFRFWLLKTFPRRDYI